MINVLILLALPGLLLEVEAQITFLDQLLIKDLRRGRDFLFKASGATGHNEADFRTNLANNVSISQEEVNKMDNN